MSHALTIVITRDVDNRFRGLLRSAMLEASTSIYVSAQLNREARNRLWDVLERWHKELNHGSIVMLWRDMSASSDIGIKCLGDVSRDLYEADGILLTRLKK
jgi:CRISPR-associated protein Cas2